MSHSKRPAIRLRAPYFIAHLFVFMALSALAQTDSREAVRGLVEKFMEAYRRGDAEAAMSLWSERSPDLSASRLSLKQLFANNKIAVGGLTFGRITIEGEKAEVRFTAVADLVDLRSGKPAAGSGKMNRTVSLVKEDQGWKIWKFVSSEEELAQSLIAAPTEQDRVALLDGNKELIATELVKAVGRRARSLSAQGKFEQALAAFEITLALARQARENAGVIAAFHEMGITHYMMGDYARAIESFHKSLKLAEADNNKTAIGACVSGLGNIYYAQGDYGRALEYQYRSLKLSEETSDKASAAVDLNNIGAIYSTQGAHDQALEFFKKSLKIKEEASNREGIATSWNNIGIVHAERGDYESALEAFQKSLSIKQALEQKAAAADVLHNIGALHHMRGDYAQALDYNKRSLALAEAAGSYNLISYVLNNIGENHLKLGQHASALEFANRSSESADRASLRDIYWQARTVAGKAHLALNQPEQAEKAFTDAIAGVEKLRGQVAGGEKELQRFFEGKVSPYYAMAELLIARNDLPQALAYAERAKGRVLLDVLENGRANIVKAMTEDEIEKDRAMSAAIISLNRQVAQQMARGKAAEPQVAALNARLETARLEYESFQTSLYALHPELKIQRGQHQPLTIDKAAELLPDDRMALIEYMAAEDNSYLFVITRPAKRPGQAGAQPVLKIYPLNVGGKELAEMVKSFRRKVGEGDLSIKKPGERLYDLLIRPAERQLEGVNKICIVPDGPLWNLPFQALHRQGKGYLLESFSIFYAPSLSVLREMTRKGDQLRAMRNKTGRPSFARVGSGGTRTEANRPELLAVGNPALGDGTATKADAPQRAEGLSPLPQAEREVKVITGYYGQDRSLALIGSQAREGVVKNDAGKYAVLHLATHAFIDDNSPLYSKILLSPASGNDQEDGILEAWELMKLDLTASLVVLSACQTAEGRVAAGEGIIGMSWALFVAGSPAAVVSQWKVDSARSTELMIAFHRNLLGRAGLSRPVMTKSEALRQAALGLLKGQFNHPAYWAGFILIGDEK